MAMGGKAYWLDKKGIMHAVRAGSVAALNKAGAFIRRRAKSSIRAGGKKGKVSAPGEPPRSHKGSLRAGILFATGYWSAGQAAVVVGPVKETPSAMPVRGTGARVLEEGGDIRLTEVFCRARVWGDLAGTPAAENIGFWRVVTSRSRAARRPGAKTRTRTIHIEARPYMGPALQAEQTSLARLWAGSVKAA